MWDILFNSTDDMSCVPFGMSDLLCWISDVLCRISYVRCEISDILFVCLVSLNKFCVLFINWSAFVYYLGYLMYRLRYFICQWKYLVWHMSSIIYYVGCLVCCM